MRPLYQPQQKKTEVTFLVVFVLDHIPKQTENPNSDKGIESSLSSIDVPNSGDPGNLNPHLTDHLS